MSGCRGIVTNWYSDASLNLLLEGALCPGDLLEFQPQHHDAQTQTHWAVYLGLFKHGIQGDDDRPCMAHCGRSARSLPLPCCSAAKAEQAEHTVGVWDALFGSKTSSKSQNRYSVRRDWLEDYMRRHRLLVRVNNSKDKLWEPYPSKEIVNRVEQLITASEEAFAANQELDGFEDITVDLPRTFTSCLDFSFWSRYDENYVNAREELRQEARQESCEKAGVFVGAVGFGLAALASGLAIASAAKQKEKEKEKKKRDEEEKKKDKEKNKQ